MSKKQAAYLSWLTTVVGFFVVGAMTTTKSHYEWLGWVGATIATVLGIIKYPREKQEPVVAYKTEEELRAERLETIAQEQLAVQKSQAEQESAEQARLALERAHKKRINDLADAIWKDAEDTITEQNPCPIVFESVIIKQHNNQDIFRLAMDGLISRKVARNLSPGRWEFGRKPEKTNLDR